MAVGRFYTLSFENVAVAAAQDLFEVAAADDKPIGIVGLTLDNVGGVADAGDAQEELLRMSIIRGHATTGTGGTQSVVPRPMDSFDTACGAACDTNNTTIASAGTAVTMWAFGWNVRVPLREYWPEELIIWSGQGDGLIVVRLHTAPADSIQVSGSLWIVEG